MELKKLLRTFLSWLLAAQFTDCGCRLSYVKRKHLVLFVLCVNFSYSITSSYHFCFFFFAKPTTNISVFTSVICLQHTGFAYCFPISHHILQQKRRHMFKNMSHISSSHRTCLNAKIKKKKKNWRTLRWQNYFFSPLPKSNLAIWSTYRERVRVTFCLKNKMLKSNFKLSQRGDARSLAIRLWSFDVNRR